MKLSKAKQILLNFKAQWKLMNVMFGGSESNKHTKDKFKSEKAVVFGLFNIEEVKKKSLLKKLNLQKLTIYNQQFMKISRKVQQL